MSILKKLAILALALLFSPVLIPFAIYFAREKKWFVATVLAPLPAADKASQADFLLKSDEADIQNNLATCLAQLDEAGYCLGFRIDWRDVDEVVAQGNALAGSHGIATPFSPATPDEDATVWQQLVHYDVWLQAHGFSVVLWDQGSDEYRGFICPPARLRRFIRAGKQLGLTLVKLDHENEQ